ncbi:MAG TPA: OmpA family protein [Candidatus Acidoferrales bacterium]|nr:OmpA family protein [Candidatus Acidoferrales bacterium]
MFFRALVPILLTSLSTIGLADDVKVKGMIKGRSGATLILQTADSAELIVLLTDSTQVSQPQGVFKARRKEMSMAALIPGLAIEAEGTYDGQKQLVAKSVQFSGDALKNAQAVQAGMHETQVQAQKNKEELEKQNAALQAQNQALKEQQEQMNAQQQKIAANRAAIAAAIARFGQLDDYYILDEVTIYFANGKINIDPKYKPQLLQLADKAKTIEAYTIEVKGYASSSGSATLNQKLSEDRANNVANFLLQDGHISLTHMLAPGAMGESRQVGNDKTAEGQAENRRVVVRVLQNKGIAGLKAAADPQQPE